ncbi:WG repeat-containing protein [Rhizobium leguminosarum]|uniref:WG repeat-containing protein n=1 Tax=Rhizobium leguminosarum TaxID=384 RepID=A0A6P0BBM5_RHILE|nr:WG repeat-containing protein [Rhizobium leguminosarum]NEI36536.1 WG repeat-containing protein [Rhizobium leguminosarum]NEI42803.1 WG repeat-containing protein [Rhizobium leguminosarum]
MERCGGVYALCGYIDRATLEPRIDRKFEVALPFSEGLAAVRSEGRFGYIDSKGEMVIAPTFDLARGFRNGHAEVVVGDKAGIIDRTGKFLLPPNYARAIPFGAGAALVRPGRAVKSDSIGFPRFRFDELFFDRNNRSYLLVDLPSGKVLKDEMAIQEFEFGTFVWAAQPGDKRYGLLAPDGTWKIEPRFEAAGKLREGRAIVCYGWPARHKGQSSQRDRADATQCGVIDRHGQTILAPRQFWIQDYRNGFFRVTKDQKVAVLDDAGRLLGGRLFDDARLPDYSGEVAKILVDGQWVGLNRAGNLVPNPEDGKTLVACPSGIKFMRSGDRIQVVGANGKPTVSYLLDDTYVTCKFPVSVRYNGKWGFLKQDGKLLVDPPSFQSQFGFSGVYAGVKVDGKWGILDSSGVLALAPQFDEMQPDSGAYAVSKDARKFWIDASGREVAEPRRLEDRQSKLRCEPDGGQRVSRNSNGTLLWGIADAAGNIVVEPKYRAITCFRDGFAWVPFDERREWCAIDRNEQKRENVTCVKNWADSNVADARAETMSDDPYESGVLWMRAELEYGLDLREKPPRFVSQF